MNHEAGMTNNNWILLFGVLVIGVAITYMIERNAKNRVRYYLENRGCEDVRVKTRLFAGGRGTITFDVEYTTPKGVRKKNSCVVHTGLLADEKIYWQNAIGKVNEPVHEEDEDMFLWS